jgi:hypothetical protein
MRVELARFALEQYLLGQLIDVSVFLMIKAVLVMEGELDLAVEVFA